MSHERALQLRNGHRSAATQVLANHFAIIDQRVYNENARTLAEDGVEELKRQLDILNKLNDAILAGLEDDESIKGEIEECGSYRVRIRRGIREGELFIGQCQNLGENRTSSRSVKLPAITLTKFSGNPLEWPAFWDLFQSSIHDRTDISASAKFHYLVSQLEGDAAMLLADFDHTDSSYIEAVRLMTDSYGKPKLLVQARLNAIFDLEPPMATASSLSRFRSQYEGHLRGLKSLGSNVDDAGYVFAAILIRKLPPKVINNINRASDGSIWNIDSLKEAIVKEIDHLGMGDDPESHLVSNQHIVQSSHHLRPASYHMDNTGEGNSSTVMTTNSNVSKSGNKYNNSSHKCLLCYGDHSVFNCVKYRSLDSKRKRAKEAKLCYNCLRESHSVSNCTNQNSCKFCKRRHHSVLCNRAIEFSHNNRVNANTISSVPNNFPRSHILPTATINLVTQDGNSKKCQSLFDTGSQKSFILNSVVRSLNLPVVSTCNISINGFNSSEEEKVYNIVKCKNVTGDFTVEFEAVAVDKMPSHIFTPNRSRLMEKLRNSGVVLADSSMADNCNDLSIIIGVDNYFKFAYGQSVDDDIYLIPTRIGNLVCGNLRNASDTYSNIILTLLSIGSKLYDSERETLNDYFPRFWDLESVGIGSPNIIKCSDPAMTKFDQTVKYENNRYTVSLPWKDDHPPLPTNYNLAVSRLNSLLLSLRKNPNKLQHYNKVMNDQLKAGFIEKVEKTKNNEVLNSKIHYLSHHAVLKDSTTSPLRVVFNCSAKLNKTTPSLNECLHSGPSLINELCEVLLRFRICRYACSADIAKAFLQVNLSLSDRDSTRFLWPVNIDDPSSGVHTYRFKVVLFGSTCSSFLLNATVLHHLNKYENVTSNLLKRNIYVDNIQNSFNSEDDMCEFYSNSRSLMSSAGFPLREWFSNSEKLNQMARENNDCQIKETTEPKLLGIKWNTVSDELFLQTKTFEIREFVTKRSVVSECAKIFDPLGIFLPVSIKCRIFMQQLWRENLDWDEKLPIHLLNEWNKLCEDLNRSHELKVKRNVISSKNVSLHIFSDSSKVAYGTVAYVVNGNERNLLFAKARVVPLKPVTLPQLELTALNFGVRLGDFLLKTFIKELHFSRVVIWSDSTIALSWLFTSKTLKPYVSQRVNEIHSLLPNAEFKHIDSRNNPADLLTRGVSFDNLIKSDLWFTGPSCISDNVSTSMFFMSSNIDNNVVPDVQSREKNMEEVPVYSLAINIDLYNNFSQLIRILCYIRKFICMKCKPDENISNRISVSDMRVAELILIKHVQSIYFADIICYLTGKVKTAPSIVHQLSLVYSDGVIKCRGRLNNSDLEDSCKTPILLPSDSKLTNLIIMHTHIGRLHSGVSDTLAAVRQRFWIPKGRQKIKSVLRKCVTCLKVQGKPYSSKIFSPLPIERVVRTKPFQVTGLDYTGALHVRNALGNIVKCYILLFTCAVSRAIHLELVCNCNEEDFIDAFKRFVARRGYPSTIISDNASTFVCASKTLQQISRLAKVHDYCLEYNIDWKFIVKRAPWAGGFYERLVGLTKTTLKKILGNSMVNFLKLQTVVIEIESILNDRPLMYVNNDLNDSEPLTPSLLLYGHRIKTFPDVVNLSDILDPNYNEKSLLTAVSNKCIVLLQKFWERWSREYLTALRERQSTHSGNNSQNLVQVGDIVQVHDSTPRNRWKLGVVTKLLPSQDNLIRSVELRLSSGLITNRPIIKLYPLEINAGDRDSLNFEKNSGDLILNKCERPVRKSALIAKDKISCIYKNL